jgi:hypothetical protein
MSIRKRSNCNIVAPSIATGWRAHPSIMTISDAQADTWSSATAKLLSGITDDLDETCESFSNNAAGSSITP